MTENKKRIVLIPAYEPDFRLIELLRQAAEQGLIAIVIDDGSGPSFTEIFVQASRGAVVLTHTDNMGKGRAIKTGLEYVRDQISKPFTVVTVDADGQHQITDAIHLCEAAEHHPNTLILGSRGLRENVPARSRFGNTITRFVYRFTTGVKIYDTQTGLRAFGSELISDMLLIPGERYEYEMNVLLQFANQQIPMKEIEIETIYIDNNCGSHFDTLRDSYKIYKEIIKYSASSFVCFLIDYAIYSSLALITAGLGSVGLTASNVAARLISASVNFRLNRRFVFKSERNIFKSAAEYFSLAAAILLGNTLVLNLLVNQLGMNQFSAKLLTEVIFFAVSWTVQHFVIFRKKDILSCHYAKLSK